LIVFAVAVCAFEFGEIKKHNKAIVITLIEIFMNLMTKQKFIFFIFGYRFRIANRYYI
jgi:hypothetical protein